jgi:hypothetical protein
MAVRERSSGGVGWVTVLFIVFLVMKLAEIEPIASWSWWWVTSPLWIGWGLALTILFAVGLFKYAR